MDTKEIYKSFQNHEEIYSLKRFFNGDIIPIIGIITTVYATPDGIEEVDLIELETREKIKEVNSQLLFKKDELPKLKEYILTLELENLPKEIKMLETDLRHKKRKFQRYKKILEENRKKQNE